MSENQKRPEALPAYVVVKASTVADLDTKVNVCVAMGYVPAGGLALGKEPAVYGRGMNTIYYQAMFRPSTA